MADWSDERELRHIYIDATISDKFCKPLWVSQQQAVSLIVAGIF